VKKFKELFVLAVLALSLVACSTVQAAPDAGSQTVAPVDVPDVPRTITVVGVGEVSLVPDIARINVGAEATSATVAEAKAEVDRQIAAIVATLKEMGIAESDIQTSHYSIHYERGPMPQVIRSEPTEEMLVPEMQGGYRVSNMLRVTVRAIESAGDVLDAVVAAGANQVYGVTFTVSDENQWQSAAREAAMADATARAEELAGLANVQVGQVLSISEVVGGAPQPMMAVERAYGGGGIAPGELELGTQVQVTFAIQ
jgi:uncharacterized protein YggE